MGDFLKAKNKKIDDVKQEESELIELILKLRHNGGVSLRKMEKILGISRQRISKIINRNL